jgi:hypothetical protein
MHGIRIPAGSEIKLGPKELADHARQRENLKYIRGHFVELIVNLEAQLDKIIERILVHKRSKSKNVLFREKVLRHRSMNFSWKSDIFKQLLEDSKHINKTKLKELSKALENLITERNRWAHGRIFYEKNNEGFQAYLEHIDSKGKLAERKLTNQYFDKLNGDLKLLHQLFDKIEVKLGLTTKSK